MSRSRIWIEVAEFAAWVGLAAGLVAAPFSAQAGALEDCWQDKLEAAALYTRTMGDCAVAVARFEDFETCKEMAIDALEDRWGEIENTSTDAACDDGGAAEDVESLLEWLQFDTMTSIGLGLPGWQTVRNLSGALSEAALDHAAALLDAEAANAVAPDPAALAKARKKAGKKFAKKWKKAAKKAKKKGFKYRGKPGATAAITEIQAAHLATVAMTGEPAPPPPGTIADTDDGIRVEATRDGEDIDIDWEPSAKVAKKAAWYELQEWIGYRWNTIAVVSSSPSSTSTLETQGFCVRIVAVKSTNTPFASGMSGDAGACL